MANDVSISFLESFVLAKSYDIRKKSLNHLTPGSVQFLYYSILNEQMESPRKETDEEKELLKQLKNFQNHSEYFKLFKLRRKLLLYDSLEEIMKQSIINFIRDDILDWDYNASRGYVGSSTDVVLEKFPSKLDPSLVQFDTYLKNNFNDTDIFDTLNEEGYFYVCKLPLRRNQISTVLSKVQFESTLNNVVSLISMYLEKDGSFDSLDLNLTLEQLEELGKAFPNLYTSDKYISQLIMRYKPSPDTNLQYDENVQNKYYDNLWKLAKTLGVASHGTKLGLMSACLQQDWVCGHPNRDRFMEYLKIPQNGVHFLKRDFERSTYANNDVLYDSEIFPTEPSDLIKRYLLHFLGLLTTAVASSSSSTADNVQETSEYKKYLQYVEKNSLYQLYLEAGILNGTINIGKLSERVEYSGLIKEITDHVEIILTDQNKRIFHPDDEVTLKIHVKNVKKLFVDVFEINTYSFYNIKKKQIDESVDLDGLIAGERLEFDYSKDAPSYRRVLDLALPSLGKGRRGVFVVVLFGNGYTSRALIRKGSLRLITRNTAVGHAAVVLDESNKIVYGGSVWVKGRKYGGVTEINNVTTSPSSSESQGPPDFNVRLIEGEFIIPYSSRGYNGGVIVATAHNEFCSLVKFEQLREEHSAQGYLFIEKN
jgi:hypothetical protein